MNGYTKLSAKARIFLLEHRRMVQFARSGRTALEVLAAVIIITALQFAALRPVYAQRGIRAQVGPSHSVALSWVLSTDDNTAGCTAPNTCVQTVYRALGACSTSSTFASIGSPSAAVAAFTDSTVVPGTYCYAVTFTQNGLESVKDTTTVILPPFSPSSLAGLPK